MWKSPQLGVDLDKLGQRLLHIAFERPRHTRTDRAEQRRAAQLDCQREFRPVALCLHVEFETELDPALAVSLERDRLRNVVLRSEEHTSELQSLMRISYAVFCLKYKTTHD